jgi:hypothetical protein
MSGILNILCLYINFEISSPSQSIGRIWVKKIGYYCLHKPKPKAEDWVLLIDESIGIGQEKLLLILGIRASMIDFTRPLKIQDMEPIIIKSSTTWTAVKIAKELETCKETLGGILYATTDGSSSIKKALQLSKIEHVYDITHAIAIMLEKMYKQNPEFKDLVYQMGQMRLKYQCSQYAHIIPPNQRSKSRFLNIEIITTWGDKVLKTIKKGDLTPQEKELLMWVEDKRSFIEEMIQIIGIIKKISIILKNNGLNHSTKRQSMQVIKENNRTKGQKVFNLMLKEYLKKYIKQTKKKSETLLCTSDVIESTFGKYKNELSKNPMNGITDLALIISALTSNLDDYEIKEAIESCKCSMIKEWSNINLCDSLSVKRKAVLYN